MLSYEHSTLSVAVTLILLLCSLALPKTKELFGSMQRVFAIVGMGVTAGVIEQNYKVVLADLSSFTNFLEQFLYHVMMASPLWVTIMFFLHLMEKKSPKAEA